MQRFLSTHATEIAKPDYAALHDWSVRDPDAFWSAAWEYCGIVAERPYERVVDDFDRMPGARWFPGATLNFAANLLQTRADYPAIVFVNERGERREIGWDELRRHVAGIAASLREHGVTAGDRVAGLLPNMPETVIAMLATTSLGAIWSSCSPDFGVKGVLERFGQIAPKVLFAVDGYYYNGKHIDCVDKLRKIHAALPTLKSLVVVRYTGACERLERKADVHEFDTWAARPESLEFAALAFAHPVYILYTSGTTGPPKSIVHGAGGTLLQHKKEHLLHTDIHAGDRVFYFTSCGWMMWHWLVSSLASGATIVLYDGSPFHPGPGALWEMAESEDVAVFGTSAKYLSALEKSGYRPAERHDLGALKAVLSTGSPLSVTSFDYAYAHIKQDLQLSSISGGTDIISCFALGNPVLPVYRGELQCRGLGMNVDVFDAQGRSIHGRKGELVCKSSFPSMPVGFWNDADGRRYRAAYFARYPGIWYHGDYAEITEHGGIVMHGRSDTVLNPGGVRIGTAEIYRIVEELPEIAESIVIDQEHEGDTRIVLFVRMQPGYLLDDAVRERIRSALREEGSPRHVPAKILEVGDIPRTMSGKIVEIAVREAVHGREIENVDALANPEALEEYRNRPELR